MVYKNLKAKAIKASESAPSVYNILKKISTG